MSTSLLTFLENEEATKQFGCSLARLLSPPLQLFFSGELGAGKTTLIRALLRALGVSGPIKSPTFALVEPYQIENVQLYHLDLYRLKAPEELLALGYRDYLSQESICLIEWPENARALLPTADLTLKLIVQPVGRQLEVTSASDKGMAVIEKLCESISIRQ